MLKKLFKKNLNLILSLPRYLKQGIVVIIDSLLFLLSIFLTYILLVNNIFLPKEYIFFMGISYLFIAIPIFWIFSLYKTIFRYSDLSIVFNCFYSCILYGLLSTAISIFHLSYEIIKSFNIIQSLILFISITLVRILIGKIISFNLISQRKKNKNNVIIYGAGSAGRKLSISLVNNPEYKVIGFIDDNKQLHHKLLFGHVIYSINDLHKLCSNQNIYAIFLALPSISRFKRNQIIKSLDKYKVNVKTLPSISEIIDGTITFSDIKDLNIDDLLSREEVKADSVLLNKNINSKVVVVTGAGGSIGSELCRQIIKFNPKKLLLLELNEYSLYKINAELTNSVKNIKIFPLLINTQDQKSLEKIFKLFKVNTVYHAAAYKHVPLVEENICEGVKNNVFSTLAIANASVNVGVSNLVLISSDKAVRPTNIMGASKRLSELCMQGIYKNNKNILTKFSIVRFGNVLESSGSVIPKFKRQIKEGGPVTLTHKDVTRYFMTTTEAAQLVIQAGAMGKNSEVFVLDMGKSIRIIDLLHKMIRLSGFSIKDDKNLDGDIEIKVIGLRNGEKLFEELLIGDNPQDTEHPKIKMIDEPFISMDKLNLELNYLENLLDNNQSKKVKDHLIKLIPAFESNSEIVDHLYKEELNTKN